MTLERRYRRIIRLFPKTWREENEDALVDTLLEHSAADRGRAAVADQVDLLRTAATLHWRALYRSPVHADASASVRLAASAGLALMTAASLSLLARLWVLKTGLRSGTLLPVDLFVGTALLTMWPLALVVATTRRTRLSITIAGSATVSLAAAYLARSTREFNFVSLDHVFLYIGFPLVVTLTLRTAVNSGHRVDRRWLAMAWILAVPLTAVLTGVRLHRIGVHPQPYSSAAFTIIAAAILVSTPAIVAIGISRPRVLLAAGLLCTPLGAAGLGQLIDSLTIHDARPGQAIAQTPQAIAITAGSLLPTAALLIAGLVASLHRARRTTAQ